MTWYHWVYHGVFEVGRHYKDEEGSSPLLRVGRHYKDEEGSSPYGSGTPL